MANQQSDPQRGLAEGQPGPSPAEHHQPAAGGRGPKTDGGEAEDDEAERRTTA